MSAPDRGFVKYYGGERAMSIYEWRKSAKRVADKKRQRRLRNLTETQTSRYLRRKTVASTDVEIVKPSPETEGHPPATGEVSLVDAPLPAPLNLSALHGDGGDPSPMPEDREEDLQETVGEETPGEEYEGKEQTIRRSPTPPTEETTSTEVEERKSQKPPRGGNLEPALHSLFSGIKSLPQAGTRGLTSREIAERLQISMNGQLLTKLKKLVEADLLRRMGTRYILK